MISGVRVVRVGVAALASTLVALGAHLTGGGWMPGPLGVAAPVVVTGLIGLWWTRRRASLTATLATAALAQAASHLLFVLGAPVQGGPVHAVHAMGTALDMGSMAGLDPSMAPALHGDPRMWASHAVAATGTALVLHYAEALTGWVMAASRWVLRWLRRTLADRPFAGPSWNGRTETASGPGLPGVLRLLADVVCRRGPPARAAA